MLETCLHYYGLSPQTPIASSVQYLARLTSVLYPCGYTYNNLVAQYAGYQELMVTFNIFDIYTLTETFRYASMFGIITNLVITPHYIEWYHNPFHKRDLFFAELKLLCRQTETSIL